MSDKTKAKLWFYLEGANLSFWVTMAVCRWVLLPGSA